MELFQLHLDRFQRYGDSWRRRHAVSPEIMSVVVIEERIFTISPKSNLFVEIFEWFDSFEMI